MSFYFDKAMVCFCCKYKDCGIKFNTETINILELYQKGCAPMLDLTNRQKDLLKNILNNEKTNISNIAKKNGVSSRTIYRDIEKITDELLLFNLYLIKKENKYAIRGDQGDLLELEHIIHNSYYELTPLERKKFIIAELLTSKEPIKLDYFAKTFNLTAPTISYYLKDIEKWLEKNNISIISKPGVGVKIESDEENIRKATTNFIYENVELDSIIKYVHKDYNTKELQDSKLLGLLDVKIISQIEKSIIKLQQKYNYPILDKVYINLTIHIALAIKRIEAGEEIVLDLDTLNNLKNTKEFEMAETLTKYIEDSIGIRLPEDEIGYITMHLLGLDYKSTHDIEYTAFVKKIVDTTIREANKTFHIDFFQDEVLVDSLTNHLMYTMFRIKSNLTIRNPMLKEIKEKYKILFKKTQKIIRVLENKFKINIPEDEIGYIAIHFGAAIERMGNDFKVYDIVVVCSSGIGSSQMLLSKLKKFPQLNIIKSCSIVELENVIKDNNIDLIISTIPLPNLDIKAIVVTPLLLDEDIKKIEEILSISNLHNIQSSKQYVPSAERKNHLKNLAIYGSNITEILKNASMIIHKSKNTENTIDELLDIHYENKKITKYEKDEILKLLIKRNNLAPIILPNKKFILYHLSTDYVDEILITVGKFKDLIPMRNILGKKELISTSFLLLAPKNKKSIETLGDLSSAIIEDDKFVEELHNSKNKKEVLISLENTLLLKYYKEIRRVID